MKSKTLAKKPIEPRQLNPPNILTSFGNPNGPGKNNEKPEPNRKDSLETQGNRFVNRKLIFF